MWVAVPRGSQGHGETVKDADRMASQIRLSHLCGRRSVSNTGAARTGAESAIPACVGSLMTLTDLALCELAAVSSVQYPWQRRLADLADLITSSPYIPNQGVFANAVSP